MPITYSDISYSRKTRIFYQYNMETFSLLCKPALISACRWCICERRQFNKCSSKCSQSALKCLQPDFSHCFIWFLIVTQHNQMDINLINSVCNQISARKMSTMHQHLYITTKQRNVTHTVKLVKWIRVYMHTMVRVNRDHSSAATMMRLVF